MSEAFYKYPRLKTAYRSRLHCKNCGFTISWWIPSRLGECYCKKPNMLLIDPPELEDDSVYQYHRKIFFHKIEINSKRWTG